MANITIGALDCPAVAKQKIEIVERKGVGHPDSICDALSEELSIALSKQYREKFGFIMHHNVDKALLIGGSADPKFGGGVITQPIEIYLTGRALHGYNGTDLNIEELALETTQNWLKNHLPNMNVSEHIDYYFKVKQGSKDLVELFERFQTKGTVPLSNDTSFGVGFAPFSDVENLAYGLEKYLNSPEIKKVHPYIGEDIKVMGVRNEDNIRLTLALAFVDKYVDSLEDYIEKKRIVQKLCQDWSESKTSQHVEISVNTADSIENGSVYITVTGTSAEAGDDGQVGRGNRVNGLITPYRPMSLEAAAGKNPVSHVGKIYNTSATLMANRIVKEIPEIEEVYCYLVSQIGKPITEPQAVDIKIRTKEDQSKFEEKAKKLVQEEIDNLPKVWEKFLNREFAVC